MEKLYYQVPYQKEFDAKVLSCEESKTKSGQKGKTAKFEIILDRTAFFPEGGGEPGDTGKLIFEDIDGNSVILEVEDTRERDGVAVHVTKQGIPVGTNVHGILDWERRFQYMQEHSGEHIISGLLYRMYGFHNVGFHMGSEETTLDTDGVISMEELLEIEKMANQVVTQNVPIHCYFPSKEELSSIEYRSKKELTSDVRIVEVMGADVCACCGTHVERTGEIGLIKIIGMIHYKGGMRISMLCGERARMDYEARVRQMQNLSVLLSAKPKLLLEAVKRQKELIEEKEREGSVLFSMWMEERMQGLGEQKERLLVREDRINTVQLRQYCDALAAERKGEVVLALKKKEDGSFQYVLASKTRDMRKLGKRLQEKLNGSGGGSCQMVQGMFKKGFEEIRDEFESAECEED